MNINLKLRDIINEQLTKTKAVLDCLLAAGDSNIELDDETIYNTIWLVNDNLKTIIACKNKLWSGETLIKEENKL